MESAPAFRAFPIVIAAVAQTFGRYRVVRTFEAGHVALLPGVAPQEPAPVVPEAAVIAKEVHSVLAVVVVE